MSKLKVVTAVAALTLAGPAVATTTVTNTFQAQIVIQDSCRVNLTNPTTLNFGSQGVLAAAVDNTSTVTLTCSTATAYDVLLNAGSNPSTAGDVSTRRMANGGSYVSYQMYRDSNRSNVWGDTIGTNSASGTGSGAAQQFTVYGRVPTQTTPAAGSYSDTVTVTVSY